MYNRGNTTNGGSGDGGGGGGGGGGDVGSSVSAAMEETSRVTARLRSTGCCGGCNWIQLSRVKSVTALSCQFSILRLSIRYSYDTAH